MGYKILLYIGCLLFGLVLVLPFHFQFFKLLLVFCLLIPIGIKLLKRHKFYIDRNVLIWTYVYVLMGLFYIFYGVLIDNPAPLIYFPIYVLWPIIWFFIAIQVNEKIYLSLLKCMRYSFTIITVTGVIAFFYLNFTFDMNNTLFTFGAGLRPGFPFLAIYSGSVTSVIFLYTFFLTLYLLNRDLVKKQDKFNLIIGFFFIFATSRRAILIILALTLFTFIVLGFFFKKQDWNTYKKTLKKYLSVLSIFVVIILVVVINLDLFEFDIVFKFIGDAIGRESAGIGYDPRLQQFDSLMEGWREKPIIGNGTGVNASVVRSETPGAYELSYVSLLFERGLIGAFVYGVQLLLLNIWILKSLKYSKLPLEYNIATLWAFDMFLFANATNPYLGAFDHLWVIFIVIAVINMNQKVRYEDLCHNKSL